MWSPKPKFIPRHNNKLFYFLLVAGVILSEQHVACLEARGATTPPPFIPQLEDIFPPIEPFLFDPTGPNASCVDRTSIDYSEFPECGQIEYGYDRVYIDDNLPQRIALLKAIAGALQLAPEECATASFFFHCMMTFRSCIETGDSEVPVLAQNPCRDVCEANKDLCVDYVVINGGEFLIPILDCDPPHPLAWGFSNYTMFPFPNDTLYDLSIFDPVLYPNVTVELPCVGRDGLPATPKLVIDCPDELVQDGKFCGLGCPLAIISDSHYSTLKITVSVCSWVSFFCCLVLFILWLSPYKRTFPNILPLWFIICVGMSSFALTFGSFVGYKEMLCEDDSAPNDFGGAACTVQGILWVYFTLAGVIWWLVIAVNMVVSLLYPKSPFMEKYGAYIYHVSWLFPLVPLVIGLANKRIGYGGDIWCTVHLTDTTVTFETTVDGVNAIADEDIFYWKVGLLIIPMCTVIGIGMIVIVAMITLLIVRRDLSIKYLIEQWRLAVFFVFYVWIYIFLFVFWGVLNGNIGEQLDEYEEYLTCTFLKGSNFDFTGECPLDRKISFPLWFIGCFILSTQGILVFVIFGTSPALWKGWHKVISGQTTFFTGSSSKNHQHSRAMRESGGKNELSKMSGGGSLSML